MWRWLVVCTLLTLLPPREARPCATAPPPGATVYIEGEAAIITWDPATQTEHFIRRAAFRSTAASFGFLVPTPTMPQLTELSANVFDQLTYATAPETVYDKSGYRIEWGALVTACLGATMKGAMEQAPTAAVQVLQTAHVAGFDATTIAADSADAMAKWLDEHGFAKTPELTEWLARYVDQHWTITAFVVAKGDKAQRDIATGAVHMTFKTERPFYPYREPRAVPGPADIAPLAARARKLRMFFIADARYAATLANAPWSAPIEWAAPLADVPIDLKPMVVGEHPFVTEFVDDSFPRKGIDEVFFARDTEQKQIKRPPNVIKSPKKIFIPVDVVAIGAIIVLLVVRKVRKYRRSKVGRL